MSPPAALACYRRNAKRRRDAPDHALPSSKQPVMTTHSAASSSGAGGSFYASPRSVHFFVRATDSKTIAMHAAWDDTVGAVLDHLAGCGYGRDLRLLYAGRQLLPEATIASLCLPPDSTLHLAARLRSTPHPEAWQLASHIAATAAAAEAAATSTPSHSLDCLVKEYILCASGSRKRGDRDDPVDIMSTRHRAEEYLDIFLQAGAAVALVRLYLSNSSFFRSFAERAIRCFLSTDPVSPMPPAVKPVTAPVLLEFCRLLSVTTGSKDSLYKSCRYTLASVLCEPLSPLTSSKSPARVIEQVLPFAREVVEVVLSGLTSESMMVTRADLEEFSNFFKVLRHQVHRWMPDGPMRKNLYNREHEHSDTWVWELHEMSMNLLRSVDECLKRLEMDLSTLSSESRGVIESQPLWANRLHILAMLTELDLISAIFEDVAHNLRFVLLAHKAPLNALVHSSKRNEHLHWLVKHKDLLCFEARRNLVLMLFSEGKDDYGELHEMLIDRSHLLDESFEYITQARPSELHSGLFMEFKNEEATGPGVLREWFCMVCQALFSPQQVLFSPCPNDQRRFYLNGTSVVDPLHLKYFIFSGRIIGLAVMHKVQVGIVLDRTLFLHLAGRSITLEDIAAADPVTYASCKRILEMGATDIDELTLTFSRDVHTLGSRRTIELCAGGQDISVNIKNREHYIDLLIKNIFVDSISAQLANFAKGFSEILASPDLQKVFFGFLDLEDFDRILGGSNSTINLKDWRSHTQYNGYKEKDRHINWFWKSMTIEQQRQLLFFWTSVKYLPSDGFGGLSSKLYIYKTLESADHLPSSHTCFYRLCLPPYPSLKVMQNQLQKITQEHVSCSFGTW
uniref:HECT-type E3 ubiquitin transferase n=1 Tax=Brachypodium sylvaticum TaxID=29664 RepID=Q2L3D3_BRASY|nr:polyubiquitin-like protein [Brachypodium sylvaticum]